MSETETARWVRELLGDTPEAYSVLEALDHLVKRAEAAEARHVITEEEYNAVYNARARAEDLAAGYRERAENLAASQAAMQDDLRDLLRVLGLSDGARSQSPHEVMREAIAQAAEYRRADCVQCGFPLWKSVEAAALAPKDTPQ